MKAYIIPQAKVVYLDPTDMSLIIPPKGWLIHFIRRPYGATNGYEAEVIGLGTLAEEIKKGPPSTPCCSCSCHTGE